MTAGDDRVSVLAGDSGAHATAGEPCAAGQSLCEPAVPGAGDRGTEHLAAGGDMHDGARTAYRCGPRL
jgi:hypothetical protein